MQFDLLSIIFLAILVGFFILGICSGFIKSVLLFVKNIVAIIVAAVLSKPMAKFHVSLTFCQNWSNSLAEKFAERGEVFTKVYNETTFEEVNKTLLLPNAIKDMVINIIKWLNPAEGETVAQVLGKTVVYYCAIAILFIAVYFLVRIIIRIIVTIVLHLEKNAKELRFIDRVLGAALYTLIGLLAVSGVCYVFTILIAQGNSTSEWLLSTMHLNDDTFTISKYLYEHNFLLWAISKIQTLLFR